MLKLGLITAIRSLDGLITACLRLACQESERGPRTAIASISTSPPWRGEEGGRHIQDMKTQVMWVPMMSFNSLSTHSHKCLQEVALVAKQQTSILGINSFAHKSKDESEEWRHRVHHLGCINVCMWFHTNGYSDIFISPKWYTPTRPCAANAARSLTFSSVLTLGRAATW